MTERVKKAKPSAPKSAPPAFATVDVSSLLDDTAAATAGRGLSYNDALNAILDSQAGGGAAAAAEQASDRDGDDYENDDASLALDDVGASTLDAGSTFASGTLAVIGRAESEGEFLESEKIAFEPERYATAAAAATATAAAAASTAAAAASATAASTFSSFNAAAAAVTPVRTGQLPPMQAPETGDFSPGSALASRARADTINGGLVSPSVMHQLAAAAADIPHMLKPRTDPAGGLRGSIVATDGIAAAPAEEEGDKKDEVRMRVGYYQMTGHGNVRCVANSRRPHASRLTPHASRLTPHASRLTHHA